MRRSGTDYERMSRIAIEVLEDYGYRQFPIDMKDLAKKMGINLVPYSSFENVEKESFLKEKFPDGFCKPGLKSTIYYNDEKGEIRTNSTIGHEIKHIIDLDQDDDTDDLAEFFSKSVRCPIPLVIYRGYSTRDELITNFGTSYEQSGYILKQVENRMKYYGKKLHSYEIEYLEFVYGNELDFSKIDTF